MTQTRSFFEKRFLILTFKRIDVNLHDSPTMGGNKTIQKINWTVLAVRSKCSGSQGRRNESQNESLGVSDLDPGIHDGSLGSPAGKAEWIPEWWIPDSDPGIHGSQMETATKTGIEKVEDLQFKKFGIKKNRRPDSWWRTVGQTDRPLRWNHI